MTLFQRSSLLLYDMAILAYGLAIKALSPFHQKAKLFNNGRKGLVKEATKRLGGEHRKPIWVHVASLGEFEQALPVIETLKADHPDHAIVLTFFSPSGYEVRKNFQGADYVFYLPLDTARNARRFLDALKPELALFVKYEHWYHYLNELHFRNIPTFLFSAVFQKRQAFFKPYGALYRKMLGFYEHIFVQDNDSQQLLASLGVTNVTVAGDTRFDRVAHIASCFGELPLLSALKGPNMLLVAGSTWPEDELFLKEVLQSIGPEVRLLIAPHEIGTERIEKTQELFPESRKYSQLSIEEAANCRIAILDTMGQLAQAYRHADIAWVGGGFTRSGVHNVLEPAVYGIPVLWGPNYKKYPEAGDLIAVMAGKSIDRPSELARVLADAPLRSQMGNAARAYVKKHLGATHRIMTYLSEKYLSKRA